MAIRCRVYMDGLMVRNSEERYYKVILDVDTIVHALVSSFTKFPKAAVYSVS